MKHFPLLFCLVLFLAFALSAQTNQDATCPTIEVIGGSGGVITVGESMVFTASVKDYDLSKLTFEWTTSKGNISEGQGTLSIRVANYMMGENVTATVKVKGLPESCENTASETGSVICYCPSPTLFDEFSIEVSQIDKAKLYDFVIRLKDDPNAQGYIFEYLKRGTSQKDVSRKIQKTIDYLVNVRKFEKDRFTILTVLEKEQNSTKLWIVPPGATAPQP